ncbi:hypothetical protein DHEL01_v207786 [Diaporthe helianthi]|uniref:F-box domain-containing protein n=1 Tax=Diaporthe helianthi TaxID=158607 RepID=A0A2P5HU95_DIAHE|nr:hypothetical protein DHEL01_v207786 [Diaporthe helianthi]
MASRPLKLERLPEEMILHILRNVHDTPIPRFGLRELVPVKRYPILRTPSEWAQYYQGIRDIQNVRLTSKMLCRIGTEFLVGYVGIDFSLESLARFQRIMEHPGIRRGVEMVRIRLPVYSQVLCTDERLYTQKVALNASSVCDLLDSEVPCCAHQWGQDRAESEKDIQANIIAAIEHSHREYKQRYQAQQSLLQQRERFIKGVFDAIKMSNNKALRLEFTDGRDLPTLNRLSKQLVTAKDRMYTILRRPFTPITWSALDSVDPQPVQTLATIIPDMLAAFSDTRITIVDLKLEITKVTASDREAFGTMENALVPISGAMWNLRKFTYIHCPWRRKSQAGPSEQETRPELCTFLYQCLPPSLRTLELESVEIGPLRCRLPGLTQIRLVSLPNLTTEGLGHMLQGLERHGVAITLKECWVRFCSWTDVLDLLRSKQSMTSLVKPRGREFERIRILAPMILPHLAPDDAYIGFVRKAELYIQRARDINPFDVYRKPQD